MRSTGVFVRSVSLRTAVLYVFVGIVNGVSFFCKRYAPENAKEIRQNAVLTADIHVDSDPLHPRNVRLMKLLREIGRSDAPVDALILAGDSVHLAEQKEYGFPETVLRLYNKTGCVIPFHGQPRFRQYLHGKDCEKTFETTCADFRGFLRFCGVDSETNGRGMCGIPPRAARWDRSLKAFPRIRPADVLPATGPGKMILCLRKRRFGSSDSRKKARPNGRLKNTYKRGDRFWSNSV